MVTESFSVNRPLRAHSHRTKANAKVKIFFDVCRLYFDCFCLSFGLTPSLPLSLGVNGHKFEAPRRHTLKANERKVCQTDRHTDRTFTFKPGLHVTFFTPFFSSLKNALNEFLWCCSHMTLKYVKKDERCRWQKRCKKRSLSIVNKNSIPVACIPPAFDRFCARM